MAARKSKVKSKTTTKPARKPAAKPKAAAGEAVADSEAKGLGIEDAIVLTTTVLMLGAVTLSYMFLNQHYPAA